MDKKRKKASRNEAIRDQKGAALLANFKAGKCQPINMVRRWDGTKLGFTPITQSDLTGAIRDAIEAGRLTIKSGATDAAVFLRNLGAWEPPLTTRQARENTRSHHYPGRMIKLVCNRIKSVLKSQDRAAKTAELEAKAQDAKRQADELVQQQIQVRVEAALAEQAKADMPITQDQISKIVTYTVRLPKNAKVKTYNYMFGLYAGIAIQKTITVSDLTFTDVAVAAVKIVAANLVVGHCFGKVLSTDERLNYLHSVQSVEDRLLANECMISMLDYNNQACYFNTHQVGEQMVHRIHRPINNTDVPNVEFHMSKMRKNSDVIRTDMIVVMSIRPIEAGERLIAPPPPDGFRVPLQVRESPTTAIKNKKND